MLRLVVNYANNSAGKCQWLRTTVDPSTYNRGPFGRSSSCERATDGTESEWEKRARRKGGKRKRRMRLLRRKRDVRHVGTLDVTNAKRSGDISGRM